MKQVLTPEAEEVILDIAQEALKRVAKMMEKYPEHHIIAPNLAQSIIVNRLGDVLETEMRRNIQEERHQEMLKLENNQ